MQIAFPTGAAPRTTILEDQGLQRLVEAFRQLESEYRRYFDVWILNRTGLSRKERPWGISWMRRREGMLSFPSYLKELAPERRIEERFCPSSYS